MRKATATLMVEQLIDYLDSLAHWCATAVLLSNSILKSYPATSQSVLARTTCYTHWNVPAELKSETRDFLDQLKNPTGTGAKHC